MQQTNQLKRSHKTDFACVTLRDDRPRRDPHKRRSQTMATIKTKPTMEIYRPPNVRADLVHPQNPSLKLNVHAKEFTMGHHELHNSKSSANLVNFEPLPLQHSKSSGNVLIRAAPIPIPIIPIIPTPLIPLLHSNTHHAIHRVNFQVENIPHYKNANWNNSNNLKRSKSLGAADSKELASKLKGLSEDVDLGHFPPEEQQNLKLAVEDPNQLPSRTLMDLVKIIMERVVEGIKYSEEGAKLCMSIIEKEKNQTFMESLINTCQQWYQERDKILRGIKAGDGTRFTAFMWFLTEMCGQLKRRKHQIQYENVQPDLVLLSILAKCCQACVSPPIKCLPETECLFFVLTSIGRDLENELPSQLEQLFANVRDGFLATAGSPAIRRTLLQLIELHASNWQLPGSSVLYYYPRIK